MKFLQILGVTVSTLLFGFASWALIAPNINFDLDKVDKVVGRVVSAGIGKRGVVARHNLNQNIFKFQLNNMPEPLGTYRPGQNYSRLENNIHPGDTITVYFWDHATNGVNIDVYQIEKNGMVLQDYKSYHSNYIFAGVASALVGLGLLVYGIWKIRKNDE